MWDKFAGFTCYPVERAVSQQHEIAAVIFVIIAVLLVWFIWKSKKVKSKMLMTAFVVLMFSIILAYNSVITPWGC